MITITPAPMELGLNRDAYEKLVAALAAQGLQARLEESREFRAGGVYRNLAVVVVYVGEHLGDVVIDLSATDGLDAPTLEVLRAGGASLGDQLRVVARPGSATAGDLKRADLRRFAIHATLSGALALAGRA